MNTENGTGSMDVKARSGKTLRIIIAVCILIFAVLVVLRITKPGAEVVTKPLPTVSVIRPEKRTVELETSLVGTKDPGDVYPVISKAAGEILEIYVKQGDHVKAGDRIAKIDNQKQLDAAKITLDGADIQVENLTNTMSLAKTNLSRMQTLYSAGDISRQAYEQAENGYDQAVAGLEGAKLQQASAKLQYDTQLEFSTVTAPADGTVESVNMSINGMATQTSPLCMITSDGDGKIHFSITDRLLDTVKPGDAVRIEKHGSIYDGRIRSIAALPESTTGLYRVEADTSDNGSIAQGSSVKVFFVSERAADVLALNTDAVYYDGGKKYVYTLTFNDENDASIVAAGNRAATVHKVEVVTGLSDVGFTEIVSGITENDAVIGSWTAQLYEGAQVQVLPAEDLK